MNTFDKSKIKSIEMIFENCESIKVPIECFEELDVYIDKDGFFNFNCHIIDNGSVEYYDFGYCISPCQRVNKYADICSLTIMNVDGYSHCGSVAWDVHNHQNNAYQSSDLVSYKEIKISVERSNKKYTLQEVFRNIKDGITVIDCNGKEYLVCEENEERFLLNTYVSDYILNQQFTVKMK